MLSKFSHEESPGVVVKIPDPRPHLSSGESGNHSGNMMNVEMGGTCDWITGRTLTHFLKCYPGMTITSIKLSFEGVPVYLCGFQSQIRQSSGFSHSSVGKELACNAGDLGSIPESGRSPGEGNGNPLQYSSWRIPWTEEPGGLQSMGSQELDTTE